jgi:predicted metalloprotease
MRALLAVLLVAVLAAGCGATDDVEDFARDARERLEAEQDRFEETLREQEERLRERVDEVRERIEAVLGDLEQTVPRADRTSPDVQAGGRTEVTTIEGFLTDVITNVDGYWSETLAANRLPAPRVAYAWVPPGRVIATGCGAPADDNAAFYCPADDTIYVALRFATAIYEGSIRGLPGEAEGGRAVGDFGVAYVIAHEYAHNLQEELGIFTLGRANSSRAFELQADCMAGAWGSSAFASGRFTEADIEEAVSTAVAVGDFDVSDANHHGTPQERRAAWLDGFESGDPSVCARYVPV